MVEAQARTAPARPDRPFRWVGGRLALDFLNTVGWPSGDSSREPISRYERFTRYERLAQFALEAGLIGEDRYHELLASALERPEESASALDRALHLRSALHWILVDVIEGRGPSPQDMRVVDGELHRALSHLHVQATDGGFAWAWRGDDRLESVLWPIVRDAAELLTSHDLGHARVCAGDPCGFIFLDTSPNHSRRWCVMQDCGNRAKARRHYARHKAS